MARSSKLPIVVLALAIIGVIDAGYDSYAIYMGQELWCPPPIDGCNTVANSPYARILGVPLGYLGVVYYVGMSAVGALLIGIPFSRGTRWLALAYAASGVCASAVFFFIQLNYIHAFCVYCVISAILTVLLTITTFMHYRASEAFAGALPAH